MEQLWLLEPNVAAQYLTLFFSSQCKEKTVWLCETIKLAYVHAKVINNQPHVIALILDCLRDWFTLLVTVNNFNVNIKSLFNGIT